MAVLNREFAGAERRFHLRLGDLHDLEEACGKVGMGAIYLRLSTHGYFVRDVRNVLRYGLRGGGMDLAQATRLVDERIAIGGFVTLHALAIDVLLALMEDIEPDATAPAGDPAEPMDWGTILASFVQMGVAPEQVRNIEYSDFVALARAMGGDKIQPPTEDEFAAMLARSEARYGV